MSARDETGVMLVTGAAHRIGREIALAMAREGWAVAVHYGVSGEAADLLVSEIEAQGGRAAAFGADLRDADAPGDLFARVVSSMGWVGCLVNNAALFRYDEAANMSCEQWDAHMQVNLTAPVFLAQMFAAQLPETAKGNIINIIDERVWKLVPTHFSYTVSKAGLWAATQMLAQSFAPRIRVNAIGPGPTLANVDQDDAEFAREQESTLLGHGTTPEEIARALKFILASPAMTGQMIALDGGQHLLWQTPDMTDYKLHAGAGAESKGEREE